LLFRNRLCHKDTRMAKAKKAKRAANVVTYVRMTPAARDQIDQIVKERGYPATIASVASEMITKGLAVPKDDQGEEKLP
jgi:molybdenum cofactor biosynthesis enzyme